MICETYRGASQDQAQLCCPQRAERRTFNPLLPRLTYFSFEADGVDMMFVDALGEIDGSERRDAPSDE